MNKKVNFKVEGYGKLIFFVFFCATASALIQHYQSVFLQEIKNATSNQIGIFVSLNSIAGIFFSTLFSMVSDRFRQRKKILSMALCNAILGYICYLFIDEFFFLLISSSVFIGVSTMITAQIFAYAKDILRKEVNDTEPYITVLRTIVSFAWVFSPMLASMLIKIPKYKGIIGSAIVSYIIAFLILQFNFSTLTEDIKAELTHKEDIYEQKSNLYILINFLVFTLLEAMNVIANTNLPLYITKILGYSNKYVGFLTALSSLMEIPCMLFLAYLAFKKIRMEYIIFYGISSGIIFFLLLKEVNSMYMIMLIFVFKAIFNAVYKGIGISFFQKMIPQNCGISTTLFTNTTRMGSIVGGIIIGSIGGYKNNFFFVSMVMGIISFLLYIWACNVEKIIKEKSQ